MVPIKQEQADEFDVTRWIAKRVRQYAEFPRAGIPRGDELPVPKHKYHAAHLMLLYGNPWCQDLSKLAKEAGCTYSLLGKWRTERRFWAMAEHAADEYLAQFLKTYIWLSEESKDREEEGSRLLADILSLLEATWGEILFERAYDKINKLLRKDDLSTRAKYHVYYLVIACAKHWKDDNLKAQIVERCKEMHRTTVEGFKLGAKKLLEKGDKAGVSQILDILGQWAVEGNSDFMDVAFGVRGKQGG